MCGIYGVISFEKREFTEQQIQSNLDLIRHRGPDDDGVFFDNRAALGFVRLKIIDLAPTGHQPMFDDTGRYVIIYNGEVYNYIELRDELKKKGYSFKSASDTEVLLKAYLEWGEDCMHRFNGMFAFVIYDTQTGNMFAARDRFGVKPFYYAHTSDSFVFCSEIPPVLNTIGTGYEASEQNIYDYLVFNRTDHADTTFFKSVKKLDHGHCVSIKGRDVAIRRWYVLKDHIGNPFNTPAELLETLTDSVRLRLRSDVPLGVSLSGGIDSSSITSIMYHALGTKDFNTFSAVYGSGLAGDESNFINEYKPLLKNMHFISPDADTLLRDIPAFVKAHGEPVPSTGPYGQYKVMELAANYVTVTLDGQGADEQLAGYHYFYGFYFKDLLKKMRLLRLISEISHYTKEHNSLYGLKTFLYFLLPSSMRSSIRVKERGYVNTGFSQKFAGNNLIADELYGAGSLPEALFNHFEYKLEHLLKWDDRNSMHFSLESRVPFMDYRLVQRTLATNGDKIINKGYTKALLRDAMKDLLPESIRMRKDKIGFGSPVDDWLRDKKFQKFITDLLADSKTKNRGYIDTDISLKLYQRHLNGELNISKDIWKWINLEMWHRIYIDK